MIRFEDAAPLGVHQPPSPPVAGCPGQQADEPPRQHHISPGPEGVYACLTENIILYLGYVG